MRFTKLTPILAISSLALACSESPTGVAQDEAPLFDRASGGSWVAMVSGGLNSFENGTGAPSPNEGGQRLDHNTNQINVKLYGDGSVKGSFTLMRKFVAIDGEGGNNWMFFHIKKASVKCLEVDGNQAWVGYVVEKAVGVAPEGIEIITQFVLDGDEVWSQNDLLYPGHSCSDKPDLAGKYRWDMGSLKIVDRR
jgi:hypothetical protein